MRSASLKTAVASGSEIRVAAAARIRMARHEPPYPRRSCPATAVGIQSRRRRSGERSGAKLLTLPATPRITAAAAARHLPRGVLQGQPAPAKPLLGQAQAFFIAKTFIFCSQGGQYDHAEFNHRNDYAHNRMDPQRPDKSGFLYVPNRDKADMQPRRTKMAPNNRSLRLKAAKNGLGLFSPYPPHLKWNREYRAIMKLVMDNI